MPPEKKRTAKERIDYERTMDFHLKSRWLDLLTLVVKFAGWIGVIFMIGKGIESVAGRETIVKLAVDLLSSWHADRYASAIVSTFFCAAYLRERSSKKRVIARYAPFREKFEREQDPARSSTRD